MSPTLPNNQLDLEQKRRKSELIKKLIEVDVGIHLVVGGMLLFVVTFMFAWKLNVLNYFKGAQLINNKVLTQPEVFFTPSAQAAGNVDGIYINQQIVSIEKAFSAQPDKIKLTVTGQLKKEVFGYLPYWALSKLDEINTKLLTSIAYFGIEVDGQGNVVTRNDSGLDEGWSVFNNDKMQKFLTRVKKNRIKTYITLKCFNQDNIVKLSTNPQAQENFINNAIYLMSSRGMDGINLDFEYIGEPDKKVIDGFSLLVGNLNKEMKRKYPNSLLTISTFATSASTTTLHDIPILAGNSDGLVIMGYDFATPKSAQAGAVAPIDGLGYSLTGSINSYLDKADPQKIILAVPYYGYDWPVSRIDKNGPVTGDGSEVKVYTYAEIVDTTRKTKINWDESAQTPWYSYTDPTTKLGRVVHFENTRSLAAKYDLINQKNLKGVGIWALGFDGRNNDLLQLLADKFAN